MERFVQGVLQQLVLLLRLGEGAFHGSGCFVIEDQQSMRVIVGTGRFSGDAGKRIEDVLQPGVLDDIHAAIEHRENRFTDDYMALCFGSASNHCNVIYLEGSCALNVFDEDILNIFCANVAVALDNLNLANELERTQKEVVERIGAVAETRSEETGNHVRRVAEYCYVLAQAIGMDEEEAQMLREAAPMHDIGKVGIPDSILNKQGELTDEEFEIMKRHTEIGMKLLSNSKSRLLDASAIVAYEHHERWDGLGYPRGLKGEEIHIYGRITAIADVFDALGSPRCYKEAWVIDEVFAYMQEQRGKQFEPKLVDCFLAQRTAIAAIRESFKD
jgi:response regulator RpfG family c-di-GMP phosphodiesterase